MRAHTRVKEVLIMCSTISKPNSYDICNFLTTKPRQVDSIHSFEKDEIRISACILNFTFLVYFVSISSENLIKNGWTARCPFNLLLHFFCTACAVTLDFQSMSLCHHFIYLQIQYWNHDCIKANQMERGFQALANQSANIFNVEWCSRGIHIHTHTHDTTRSVFSCYVKFGQEF